jgi:hypothetical protein
VFEASTGVRVTSFTLDGTAKSCPDSVTIGNSVYVMMVDNDALTAKLRPIVETNL